MARPPFKPTAAMRRMVAAAAGGGVSHETIAATLAISRNTLEKYFEEELSAGAMKRRVEVVVALYAAAKRGNVSAAKAYLAGQPELFSPAQPVEGEATQRKPTAKATQQLGKKQQADVDARTVQAGTGWDDLLPPAAPLQ